MDFVRSMGSTRSKGLDKEVFLMYQLGFHAAIARKTEIGSHKVESKAEYGYQVSSSENKLISAKVDGALINRKKLRRK